MSQGVEVFVERRQWGPALVVTGVKADDYPETPVHFILTRALLMTMLAWGAIFAVAYVSIGYKSFWLFVLQAACIFVPIVMFLELFSRRVKSERDDVHVFDLINDDMTDYTHVFDNKLLLDYLRNALSDPRFSARALYALTAMRTGVSPERLESELIKINQDRTRVISSPSLLDRV